MLFLNQEIPDPPADCELSEACRAHVMGLGVFMALMSVAKPVAFPDGPPREARSEIQAMEIACLINNLPGVMEKLVPSTQRCAGCIIDCALGRLQEESVQALLTGPPNGSA